MFRELLWNFSQIPDGYVVLDSETTGLPDENGRTDIVSLGIVVVQNREARDTVEFLIQPQQSISQEAETIHGISNEQAATFASFQSQWPRIREYLNGQLVVIHNASFDWPILLQHIKRFGLKPPNVSGVFCSQKASIPWALAMNVECGQRGPSLDALTATLSVKDLREESGGIHGAKIDSLQTAFVVERLRGLALEGSP